MSDKIKEEKLNYDYANEVIKKTSEIKETKK